MQAWTEPRDIDTIEYFASPDDICRAFAGLQQLAAQPGLAPLGSILSANNGDIGLDPAQWPAVWFKGGSEPGVPTLGCLVTNSKGQTFVVVAMRRDPAAALSPSAEPELLAIAQGAFGDCHECHRQGGEPVAEISERLHHFPAWKLARITAGAGVINKIFI